MGALTRIASLAVLVAAWQFAALEAGSRLLPAPMAVLRFILEEAERGDLAHNVGVTLLRVAISFAVAMVLGILLGVALGRSKAADLTLDTPLLVLLNTPALVITVLAYVWVGLTETAAILAVVLNKLPNVAVIVREGARNLDPGLDEMARAYRFDRRTWAMDVLVPQLQPYVVTAARSGLSLAWKIVLVVELLGRPDGVGFAINYYFVQSTDVAAIIGYSLVFMTVMIGIDVLLLQRLEAHVRRWR
ncbi:MULTISPECIES: ABC transporter permease [Methylobacterium]|jgi:NitT/TauT family transport system permease protein|uniref:NitT/TauT family transport system permease protein n=1 Tax=Methylobacterium brachiatum TaxID=269660 RepID=A0AAJ1TR64_9HYPH|nr:MULTISPECIES: ABC transporter permease subunit [Methylobacterium]EIZ84159.1 binding-protein-dependent transport system inner membrane protein [Methylobacterium sp. GXF4]MCB4800593.1 ABC transporter permease subunit [Methylobacterium brachiatum]MDF2597892.1 binding-protein-dependent transport system inner rane component [Methylobacterium brachiatum]MDH2308627.1 ABC transporter permease subunit [Methylobacterium brachiatum]MDQ0541652.1 NitT/TauT family transport system permease protein [Methy